MPFLPSNQQRQSTEGDRDLSQYLILGTTGTGMVPANPRVQYEVMTATGD